MKIVCFHLNQVGDLAFSLPALKCIRDSYPDAVVTSVVRPGIAELLSCTGLVDDILIRRGGFNKDKIDLARDLAAKKFDLAVVFSQSAECAVLARVCAPRRYGFINTSLGFLLTDQIDFVHPPSTENNLRLMQAIGCKITQRDYVDLIAPSSDVRARAEYILAEHEIVAEDPIIVFSPGTSGRRSVKEWTDEGFVEVGKHFIRQGYKVVVLGTQPASEMVKECPQIIDLSGKTRLGEALAILWRSITLIAVDSGILHLAAAAGTKVVGLYGPSNYKITGPQGAGHEIVTAGEACSPCVKTECSFERKCMTNIDARSVIDAVQNILSRP